MEAMCHAKTIGIQRMLRFNIEHNQLLKRSEKPKSFQKDTNVKAEGVILWKIAKKAKNRELVDD